MFNESIDILWLGIALSVMAVSGFLCYLIFHTAHLVRESKRTVEDVNDKLKRVNPALDAVSTAATQMSASIQQLRENVIDPLLSIGAFLKSIVNIKNTFFNFGKTMDAFKEDVADPKR